MANTPEFGGEVKTLKRAGNDFAASRCQPASAQGTGCASPPIVVRGLRSPQRRAASNCRVRKELINVQMSGAKIHNEANMRPLCNTTVTEIWRRVRNVTDL